LPAKVRGYDEIALKGSALAEMAGSSPGWQASWRSGSGSPPRGRARGSP